MLAVVVATPCTAPFMGGALAFAFTAPAALAVAIFVALGLGLALPFLLVGFVPALARLLPRPGAWMDTFKQVLAFPMYLTAVWLIWVLGRQRGVDAVALVLIGMTVIGAGLWWWGRLGLDRRPLQRLLAMLLVGLGLGVALSVGSVAAPQRGAPASEEGVVAYDAAALQSLRSDGRVVFVNMTADWCVTCKANEKTVLSQERFKQALAETNAVYMKGDWTNVDPEITRFLESHGAYGVPLYVVYAGDAAPQKLATVLTPDMVEQALRDAAH